MTRVNDGAYEGEGEERLCLQDIVTLNGIKLQDSIEISDKILAQGHLYEDRGYDQQWGEEHLGNEYAEIQQLYQNAVRSQPR